jgi:heterodisulfide reductase subunit B
MKVGYYPGCSLHSTGVEYDLSTRKVCSSLGIELEEIREWVCCGSSPAHQTDELMSLVLPAVNLSILKEENGLDEVCAPCASCFSRLRFAQAKAEDAGVRRRIEEVSGRKFPVGVRVMHALDLILEKAGTDLLRKKAVRGLNGLKVACYYGCLITRPPKITGTAEFEVPQTMETVLEAVGAEPVDWNMRTCCCGASLALTGTEAVLELSGRILDDADACGAEALAVGCPLCHSNLDTRQAQMDAKRGDAKGGASLRIPVFYFTELLGLALGLAPGELGIPRHITDAGKVLEKRRLT